MKSFHFDLGNSTTGPIGFCARVDGEDMNDAVVKLKKAIDWFNRELDVKKATGLGGEFDDIEYLEVYFNTDAITWKSIDEEDDIPVEPEAP